MKSALPVVYEKGNAINTLDIGHLLGIVIFVFRESKCNF